MPKCPKCQYFSFDSGDRCRNCGYDFSLALDLPPEDLPIRGDDQPIGPLDDLTLTDDTNLPLFAPGGDPDAPLVTPTATPRAPLSVRRAAPTTTRPARPRRERSEPTPEPRLALDTAEMPIVEQEPEAVETPDAPSAPNTAAFTQSAGTGARLGAGAIDLTLLAGLDVMVLYFTLKVLDLTFGDLMLLPWAPLLSFFALLDGGYLAIFVAAGGQTIGKMAAGIRVVPADPAAPPSERVTFGHAIVRTVAFFVSLALIGLGLLPALFGERRGLHDRLADTRVIKA
jgi:uncharacterized RDD family membrane protein YckC